MSSRGGEERKSRRFSTRDGRESIKMGDTIRVTLVKSGIGRSKKIRDTLRGLGLTKMHKTVELKNTPAIRGMIEKVVFLVRLG
jgi:large subunit ribosomal protein L30